MSWHSSCYYWQSVESMCALYVFGFKSILFVFWFVTGLVFSDCFSGGNHWLIMYLNLYLD